MVSFLIKAHDWLPSLHWACFITHQAYTYCRVGACDTFLAQIGVLDAGCVCRFLRVIIVSSFREEAAGQKHMVGIHHDMAALFGELSQNLRGAPSNARTARLFTRAAPFQMKVNVWARLRGQQAQLTIQVPS